MSRPGRGLAIAALVVGIGSLLLSFVFVGGIVAIVLGLVARAQAGRSAPGRTRGMATAGAALGTVSLVLGGLLVALIVHIGQTNRSLTSLRAGDCFDSVGGVFSHYRLHPCSSPHRFEAAGLVDDPAPSGDQWPGLGGFGQDQGRCDDLTRQYIGGSLDTAKYATLTFVPTKSQWDHDVRRVVCAVDSPDGAKVVGSVRDSGGVTNSAAPA